jgi:hypothetical protein
VLGSLRQQLCARTFAPAASTDWPVACSGEFLLASLLNCTWHVSTGAGARPHTCPQTQALYRATPVPRPLKPAVAYECLTKLWRTSCWSCWGCCHGKVMHTFEQMGQAHKRAFLLKHGNCSRVAGECEGDPVRS